MRTIVRWCVSSLLLDCLSADPDHRSRVQRVLQVINEGSLKQLLGLHGIGVKRAEAIIDSRPFSKVPSASVSCKRL